MDKVTEDEEIVRLLDVKDIEFIETSELIEDNEINENRELINANVLTEEKNSYGDKISNGEIIACTERRSDEPTELSFEKGDTKQYII